MKYKKIGLVFFIISLLALAFFWNDLFRKTPPKLEPAGEIVHSPVSETEVQTLVSGLQEESHASVDLTEEVKEQPEGQYSGPAQTETGEKSPKEQQAEHQLKLAQKEPPAKQQTEAAQHKAGSEKTIVNDSSDVTEKPIITTDDTKDPFLTDPVPEGKPSPVEWQDITVNKAKEFTITLSVTAATILDNLDQFDPDKLEVLPSDGVIYKAQTVTFYEGESVFDVLLREMKSNKIHMEFSMVPMYNSHYIEGINNIYEFDCGELSGWMYKVNGWFPNYGSSRYQLQDGDVVEWVYTCDLGRDVGDEWNAAGSR